MLASLTSIACCAIAGSTQVPFATAEAEQIITPGTEEAAGAEGKRREWRKVVSAHANAVSCGLGRTSTGSQICTKTKP